MTRQKAVDKIMLELGLPNNMEDRVWQWYGELTGSSDSADLDTVKALKEAIQKIIMQ